MREETLARHQERVIRVAPHILAGIEEGREEQGPEHLARLANTAPDHFRRVFRDLTGEPIQRYVRKLRLVLAAYRLLFSARSIAEVATTSGYLSHAAFSRAFREVYGLSPADLRRSPPATLSSTAEGPGRASVREFALTARRVAFVRHFDHYATQSRAWRQLRDSLAAHGIRVEASAALIVSHDDPDLYMGAKTRQDICAVVNDDFRPDGQLGLQLLPGGNTLVCAHKGPPEFLPFTYMHLAVTAVIRGSRLGHCPPLPYYVEYDTFPTKARYGFPEPTVCLGPQTGCEHS